MQFDTKSICENHTGHGLRYRKSANAIRSGSSSCTWNTSYGSWNSVSIEYGKDLLEYGANFTDVVVSPFVSRQIEFVVKLFSGIANQLLQTPWDFPEMFFLTVQNRHSRQTIFAKEKEMRKKPVPCSLLTWLECLINASLACLSRWRVRRRSSACHMAK